MRSYSTAIILVSLWLCLGCGSFLGGGGGGPEPEPQLFDPSQTLPISLHGSARGLQWWYEQPDGFGAVSGVAYASAGCANCHTSSCADCHESPSGGAVLEPQACMDCHGRLEQESVLQLTDFHIAERDMICSDCHSKEELHGDGTTPDSMFSDGATATRCENCHTELPANAEHSVHGSQFHCDACHMESAITCYNCHFETLTTDGVKKAAATFKDFILLLNGPDGRVRAGSYQSVVYEDKLFVAFGPYHSHTVTPEGRNCGDCHGSERMLELRDTGAIQMSWWNDAESKVEHTTGVVPFVPDKLDFQFVTLGAGGAWEPIEPATSTLAYDFQYEFCEPLNADQLAALGATSGSTSPIGTLPNSLHGTANGMKWWYEQPDGLGPFSGVDFAATGCANCHTSSCDDCHADAAAQQPPDEPAKCLNCHGQMSEGNVMQLDDLHIAEAGMKCSDCHSFSEMHGTGELPDSMFDAGGLETECQDCHTTLPDNMAHSRHGDDFHCDSCHMESAITCYNCHFETFQATGEKKAAATFEDFIILMNGPDGKVRPGNYQSVVYEDKSFVAFGPYHSHTVMREGRACLECHANERIAELNDTGAIQMTWWNDAESRLEHTTGVIPFVPDKFDWQFVDLEGGDWTPVSPAEHQDQWEYCTPLTEDQLAKLGFTPPELTLPNSLHGTANGMRWWYEQPDGFGPLSGVSYEAAGCGSCHAQTTSCGDCHNNADGSGGINQPDGCKACHGRIDKENVLQLSDLHMAEKGMLCSDCHTFAEAHGTGELPDSMFDEGGLTTKCEDCHTELPPVMEHNIHGTQFHCDACHVESVITCYNCHFESLLDTGEKKPAAAFSDFVILLNGPDGRVRTGSYQAVKYADKTFVAFGPYHGHTITADGRNCDDCHDSARITELNDTGSIAMTWWDGGAGEVRHATGVIPFAPDKFTWQFVDLVDGNWVPFSTELDGYQYEFCTPLSADQLDALGVDAP